MYLGNGLATIRTHFQISGRRTLPPHRDSYTLVPIRRFASLPEQLAAGEDRTKKNLSNVKQLKRKERELTNKNTKRERDSRTRSIIARKCVSSRYARTSRVDLPEWLLAQLARNVDGTRAYVPIPSPERQYNCLLCTRPTRYPSLLSHFNGIFGKPEASLVRAWRTNVDVVISFVVSDTPSTARLTDLEGRGLDRGFEQVERHP